MIVIKIIYMLNYLITIKISIYNYL